MTRYKFSIQKLAQAKGIKNAHQLQVGAGLYARNARQLWEGEIGRIELSTINTLCDFFKCAPGDLFEKIKEPGKKKST
jgi:DNA-binding Xre family transcriptional regulator